jgi:pimeloyl-ACP methyl ester carboxylesterase
MRRIPTSQSRIGSIFLLGGQVGDSGEKLVPLAQQLAKDVAGYDIIIPDTRGTGSSNWLGCAPTDTSISCQSTLVTQYGAKLQAFSVDEMAYDTIELVSQLRQPNDKIHVYGLQFGSYLINRILAINSSVFDSVTMDGVLGTNANVSDIDIQRNNMAVSLVNNCTSNPNSTCASRLGLGYDTLTTLKDMISKLDRGVWICSISYNSGITPKLQLPHVIFDRSLRSLIPATVFRLTRCNPRDNFAGPRIGLFVQEKIPTLTSGGFSPLLAQHVILSEFGRNMSKPGPDTSLFSTRMTNAYASALQSGWVLYEPSPYRYVIPNHSIPTLLLNGEIDPYSPLSRAREYASNYQASNQHYFTVPSATYNTVFDSPMITNTSKHCAYTMVASFMNNQTVDSTCLSMIVPLSFEETATTRVILGDSIYDGILPYQDGWAISWIYTILYSFTFVWSIVGFILLLCTRKVQPVRSRFIAPYLGLGYMLIVSMNSLFSFIGKLVYQIFPIYWSQGIYLSIILLAVEAYMIQTIRYVLLRKMYGMLASSTKFNVKLFKTLTSNWVYITAISVSAVIFFSWTALFTCLNAFYGTAHYFVLIIGHIVLLVVCVLMTGFTIVYDAIYGYHCSNNIKDFYGPMEDPLAFRLEMSLLFAPTLATGAIGLGIYYLYPTNIAVAVLIIVFHMFAVLFSGGYVLLFALGRKILCRVELPTETIISNSITSFIADEAGAKVFAEYTKNEFSFENFAAFKDTHALLTSYHDMPPAVKRQSVADIYDKYLDEGSDLEVNIDGNTKKKATELVRGNSFTEEDGEALLKTMHEDMLKNLQDTFSRLKHTEQYSKVVQAMEMKKGVMNDAKLL